ncbi:MAG: hypothetical protein CM15mV122_050 [uncultured marine virus]|nr:MAG: hypothetical protein CM15mV122_050 [uncultured marine virus]
MPQGGRGGPSVAGPKCCCYTPAFNIVGASDTKNPKQKAIGGQAQQPVKAFVVSNDVRKAQELDRNIVEGASMDKYKTKLNTLYRYRIVELILDDEEITGIEAISVGKPCNRRGFYRTKNEEIKL